MRAAVVLALAFACGSVAAAKDADACTDMKDAAACSASSTGCTWWDGYGCWSNTWDDTSKDEEGDKDKDGAASYGQEDTGKKSSAPCNATHMLTADLQAEVASLPRTCIQAAPDNGPRCWWTYVPTGLTPAAGAPAPKVPLIVDMHGGGGCAAHQAQSSGFRTLGDSLRAQDSFIVVWPQGAGGLWASCGADGDVCTPPDKTSLNWDDVAFLEQMLANIISSESRVDSARVFVTGFSMGCMMAHRFALERSAVVAGLGCHGGEMNLVGANAETPAALDTIRARFNVQRMPAFLTIGDQDSTYFPLAQADWNAWAYLNGCSRTNTTRAVALTGSSSSSASARVASSCAPYTPALETLLVVIVGGGHAPDARLASATWEFLKRFRRAGAADKLPPPAPETTPYEYEDGGGQDTSGAPGFTPIAAGGWGWRGLLPLVVLLVSSMVI